MAKQKNPTIIVDGQEYLRIPIKTHIITDKDDIVEVADTYSKEKRQDGDIIVISESVVAITQGRALIESEIKIGLLAKILWRFVRKVPYGIGLRSPATMQCAINETGGMRILAAAVLGGITRLCGRRGDFYRIAGMQAALIDAAHTSPIPPYNNCVILGPKDPDKVASAIKAKTGCNAAIVDVNDIGGSWAIGLSDPTQKESIQKIMKDNPLGQKDEQTPLGIIRKV